MDGLRKNRRAISSEVLKIAAALLVGFAVFAILAGFAFGPKEADSSVGQIGQEMLNYTQSHYEKILSYNET